MKIFISSVLLLSIASLALPVHAVALPGIPDFIDEMVAKHQFDRDELREVFAHAQHQPAVIEAISRPPRAMPWLKYRASFVNKMHVRDGLEFWQENRKSLQRAEKQYGVPQEIIVALIGVETIYGRNMGSFSTLDALTTLAFDYPRRAAFFRDELENYLLLARERQFDVRDVKSSFAGAIGIPQFMPSSYRNYAVDFNRNSTIDLRNEPADAIGSVGNYLKGYGWVRHGLISVPAQVGDADGLGAIDAPRSMGDWQTADVTTGTSITVDESARLLDYTVEEGKEYWLGFNNFEVITRYNNSDYYAMSVFQLAEALKAARKVGLSPAPHRYRSHGRRGNVAVDAERSMPQERLKLRSHAKRGNNG